MDTHSSDSEQIQYCICRSTVSNVFMIMCDNCEEWFHGDCVGINHGLAKEIDVYCCPICQKNNTSLKTTYNHERKKIKQKQKVRKVNKSKPSCSEKAVRTSNDSEKTQEPASTFNDDVRCFNFVDTTIRKAKTVAYEKFKKNTASESDNDKNGRKKNDERRQCYGPECTNASQKQSKYCSDACGMALARNRIVEILPERIRQYTSSTPAADLMNQKKLADIRTNLQKMEQGVLSVDGQIAELRDQINRSKQPGNSFEEVHSDDVTLVNCVLCGVEVQHKSVEKHMELCYRRQERKILVTQQTKQPGDEEWKVFCNQKMAKNVYCKKLRVLCPLHSKDHRREGQVCGYPLRMSEDTIVYCGNVGKTCTHTHWEEIQRAELDLKKFNLLIEYNRLKREEGEIRKQMAARGDLLSLLLNQTVTH